MSNKLMSLPFYSYLFQVLTLPELYIWSILTGWAAILLILSALALFFQQPRFTKKAWWQYIALLLVAGLGLWSLIVAYNGYQQWLNFNALLPVHGVFVVLKLIRTSYPAAIQRCQLQFVLTAGVLVVLIGIVGWRFLHTFTKKIDRPREASNHFIRSLICFVLFMLGLYCLMPGILLIAKFYFPLIYAPQMLPFQFDEPTTLELMGLFTVTLGGPFIFLLLSVTGYVESRYLSRG